MLRARDGVLTTKLFAPRPRHPVVRRARLARILDRAATVPLTLVVAPAGWGKTTLVADWLSTTGRASGWVWLERTEDDPIRFWRHLLHAVGRAAPRVGRPALELLDAAGTDVDRDVLPALVNSLAAAGAPPILLVLDDLQTVRNPVVHRQLGRLLEHRPAALHLVLLSRSDPPLAVGRLRLSHELVEIRSSDLHFSVAEAAELMRRRLGRELSAGDIDRLVERTEGWAAGLHLVALRLADQRDPTPFIARFTGADRHIVDYLGEEVLAGQEPGVLDFLLRTAVLTRLCAPLCAEVTGRADSARMLDHIERASLFLTPLDEEHRWLRYHQLFRDILLLELNRTAADAVPALHRRAAMWYARSGDHHQAVAHAAATGDDRFTAELIGNGWHATFNAGQTQTVESWLAALPEKVVAADPRLTSARLWLAMDAGRLDTVEAELHRIEAAGTTSQQAHLVRALHTFKAGAVGAAAARLADVRPSADAFDRTVHRLLIGLTGLWSGDLRGAGDALEDAIRVAAADGNRLAGIYATGCRALVAVVDRSPAAARAYLADVQPLLDAVGERHFVAAFPSLARARLALEEGDDPGAVAAAQTAVDLSERGAGRIERAAALLTAGRAIRQDGGDPASAGRLLSRARAVLRECPDPGPVVLSWLAAEPSGEPATGSGGAALTGRELDILGLLPGPLSQRDLAAALFVSQNTLKTHLRAIYRKLGARSRADAVLRARRAGLI